MKRREFVAGFGGATLAWPLAAGAQQPARSKQIGYVGGHVEDAYGNSIFAAFRDGLADRGWIDGRNIEGGYHEVALLDLLPAGFEIETVLTDDTVKSFPFLDALSDTRITEARDDRFFASFNLGRRSYRSMWDTDSAYGNTFHVAYIVRAVTPGSFALPAVNVSDMYAPRVYARSGMGSVTIAPR